MGSWLAAAGPASRDRTVPGLVIGSRQRIDNFDSGSAALIIAVLLEGGGPGPLEQEGAGNARREAPESYDKGGAADVGKKMKEHGQPGLRAYQG